MTSIALLTDGIEWMRQLQASIWTTPDAPGWCYGRAHPPQPEETRPLTRSEWERVRRVIEDRRLPATVINVHFGFGIALAVFEHAPVPGTPPEMLLVVSYEQLPGTRPDDPNKWDKAWKSFKRIITRPANLEALDFYGMEAPRDRQYYEY